MYDHICSIEATTDTITILERIYDEKDLYLIYRLEYPNENLYRIAHFTSNQKLYQFVKIYKMYEAETDIYYGFADEWHVALCINPDAVEFHLEYYEDQKLKEISGHIDSVPWIYSFEVNSDFYITFLDKEGNAIR